MGAGGRRDPNLVKIARLDRTHTCPLAREMRRHLRNLNGKMNYPVVFSTEHPVKGTTHQPVANGRPRSVNGTISFLPGMFGLMMAGHVINQLLEPTTGG
jgi:tRNA A37 threonylcarbamoyladenosine dehydratase